MKGRSGLLLTVWPAPVLCVGTLPLWELAFDIQTPTKLLELTNPNSPLLRRLALEAPGTYHHSIVVANLAESAADAIGANAMLVRAGAYYMTSGSSAHPKRLLRTKLTRARASTICLLPSKARR